MHSSVLLARLQGAPSCFMSQTELLTGDQTVFTEAGLQQERNEACELKIEAEKPPSSSGEHLLESRHAF